MFSSKSSFMKFLSIFLVFQFLSVLAIAQITIETERDENGNVLFFSKNPEIIPYSVILNFPTLQNLTSTGGGSVMGVAMPGRIRLATLKPTLAGQGTNYSFTYSFAKGNVYGKNKTEPVYLIPVKEGVEVQAFLLTTIENRLGRDEVDNPYRGVSFRFEEPTVIVAPRKGIVAEIKMEENPGADNLDFSSNENHIEIYHEDGTITRIMVLKSGSQKVKVGQMVFPGDELAESAGENYNSGRHVRMVCLKTEKVGTERLKYTNIPVKFSTPTGNREIAQPEELEVVFPREIITLEMSKKEMKVFEERK
jgi:hypothetical protein